MTDLAAIAVGLVVLVIGGELIVRGASGLALSLGISPIIIGLTVVAFGTSAPEMMVALGAAFDGSPDIAVGNVVGSNIYNILMVLGLAALVRPLLVRQQLVRFDVPLVIAASLLLWVMVIDGKLVPLEGTFLVGILALYMVISVRSGRRESASIEGEYRAAIQRTGPRRSRLRDVALFAIGMGALVVGAEALVGGSTSLARTFEVSELVIGLTVVAIGTSLPELVTSLVAALKGHRDLAVGNVVGSNLFNILGVLGLTAVVAPGGIPVASGAIAFDIPVMIGVAVACLPLLFTGNILRRWEGALFVGYAAIYTTYLVLGATGHPLRGDFAAAMLWFVLPLTLVTIATVLVAELRARRIRATEP